VSRNLAQSGRRVQGDGEMTTETEGSFVRCAIIGSALLTALTLMSASCISTLLGAVGRDDDVSGMAPQRQ